MHDLTEQVTSVVNASGIQTGTVNVFNVGSTAAIGTIKFEPGPGTKGPDPAECRLEQPTGAAAEVAEAIEKAGGCLVGPYKEPLAGHPVLLCVPPIDAVEATPFQRDLSDAP